jgi:hypothetical protein
MIGARLQGKGKPPNAKAVSNDKAVATAMPSATATGRGKPSDLIAFSPPPGAGMLIDFGDKGLIKVKDHRKWLPPWFNGPAASLAMFTAILG